MKMGMRMKLKMEMKMRMRMKMKGMKMELDMYILWKEPFAGALEKHVTKLIGLLQIMSVYGHRHVGAPGKTTTIQQCNQVLGGSGKCFAIILEYLDMKPVKHETS